MHRGKGLKFVGDSRVTDPSSRKKKTPKDYSEYPGKTEAFWPDFLLKEWLVGAVFLVGYLVLTVAHPSPLERPADPTDTAYIPLPDWYFLFLYQLLKYEFASGPYNIIGAIVMPGLAFGALLLVPFLDTSKERSPWKRPLPTGFMLLAIASIIFLTWESVANHDWEAAKAQGEIREEVAVEIDETAPGFEIYQGSSCIGCHGNAFEGGIGKPLIGLEYTAEEIVEIAHEGIGTMPGGTFQGTEEELQQLAEFITTLQPAE
ncbi:c-type cytochrome [Psychrobacillus sp. FSL W7-1457]|uniref:menaquinol-cytochrome c reductase cytochrome b/c subunit n=1 Tax=unclassified Psychrobacillus TaxID=2636677 RepID=UPI00203F850D|nr:menaquinol-cytochrome c reductase cytochrome b/c subunit [Psychrobacillus sp. MER TA 171]MCM3358792.1 c-type cytochrome [Psychrobacillus sp. MER TA 171]